MTKIIKYRLPCPSCTSSDAYHLWEDGHGYCFSCKKYFKGDEEISEENYSYQYIPLRGLTKKTLQFFEAKTKVNSEGKPLSIHMPYLKGVRARLLEEKKFWSEGDMSTPQLFGQDRFSQGCAKAITIYESPIDAMSGYQMLGGWP